MENKTKLLRSLRTGAAALLTASVLGAALAGPSFADRHDHRDHRDEHRYRHDDRRYVRPGYGYGYGAPAYVQAPPPVVYGPPPPPAGLNFLFSFH